LTGQGTYIPIHDEHTLGAPLLDRHSRSDRDVVVEAEAHSTVLLGVVAGWTHDGDLGANVPNTEYYFE
jgi:hypothetical protein